MNAASLEIITHELKAALSGRRFGKVFQLSRSEIAIDFRLDGSRYLYISVSPADPAVYLITRRLKDLERSSGNPSPLAMSLRKRLGSGFVTDVRQLDVERVLEIELEAEDETGTPAAYRIIVQLTGRSANLFLVDGNGVVLNRLRETAGEGQQIGEEYRPPARVGPAENKTGKVDLLIAASLGRPSHVLEAHYAEHAAEQRFRELARSAGSKLNSEIRKREKLLGKLKADLVGHGDADEWKKYGDLLLANASAARREGGKIYVTDFYQESAPELGIEVDENSSITEAAETYYRKYTKARNAAAEVNSRVEKVTAELENLRERKTELELAIEAGDEAFLTAVAGDGKPKVETKRKSPASDTGSFARTFISSDGFEILVGKKAKDNDQLTFKMAKSLDTWMHAADYPGSHVVVRNPNRAEVPHRTLLEAAQLAAFYSQGKAQTKAAVHYTQKKFVNKPKGAPPGLVSLASFKTLLVEPGVPDGIKSV